MALTDKSRCSVYLLLALLLNWSAWLYADEMHLGILEWRKNLELQQNWRSLHQALQQAFLDTDVHLHLLKPDALESALAEGRLDFVITNPGHYVQLGQQYDLAPLATLLDPVFDLPSQAVGSVLVVRSDRTYPETLHQLRGLKIGAVTPQAFGGFQLIRDELERQGLNLQRDIGQWVFTGYPMEQLLERLDAGEVDAVILRSCLLESLAAEHRLQLDDYRVLHPRNEPDYPCQLSSNLYPNWPFLSTGHQAPERIREVLITLLQLKDENGLQQWSAPLSYQPVHALFARLRLGPYAAFPQNPLLAFLYPYRYGLLVAASLLLLLLGHYLRVRYLVQRRTEELLQLMQQSQTQQQELMHLSRFALMGELAAGLAHELNQPLTAIVNYAHASERLLQTAPTRYQQERLQQAAGRIVAQAERAADIIRHLRGFLRKQQPQPETLHINAVLQDAVDFMEAVLRQARVQLEWQLAAGLPDFRASRVEVLQILINLLTNAVDAMQNQPETRRGLVISSQLQSQPLAWIVTLKDSGEGLSEAIQKQAFEPFFTSRAQGMGLGLSLSRKLVEQQGGSLTLFNLAVGGACARLEWPIDPVQGRT